MQATCALPLKHLQTTYWQHAAQKKKPVLTAVVSIPLAALEDAIEALTSGAPLELPLLRPQITLVQDYSLPLERYDDYEDDEGELRAESNLAEKFGESSMNGSLSSL